MIDLSGVVEAGTIPDGTYAVIVEKAEVKDTATGGEMIKLQLKVKEGPATGRTIFDNFNIKNANAQAVQIGLSQLKAMMKAFGHANPNKLDSTKELVGLKGSVTVKTIDEGGSYGPQTKVRAYKPLAGQVDTNGAGVSTSNPVSSSTPTTNANPFS